MKVDINSGMRKIKYRVTLEKGEDGWFVVEIPSLPGCISQGRTKKSAMKNIKEAAELYIESLKLHKEPIPPSTEIDVVEIIV